MIAIQTFRQSECWKNPINWKILAVLTATLALFAVLVLSLGSLPSREAAPVVAPSLAVSQEPGGQPSLAPSSPTAREALLVPTLTSQGRQPPDLGTYPAGATVEITLDGPTSQGMSRQANPFLEQVDVTFTDSGGRSVVVPAFYDGDGSGGIDGNVWKVRFATDSPGEWTFATHSREERLGGHQGRFQVVPVAACQGEAAANLRCRGSLDYNGSHYLRFKNGDYWIKGGVDDPENFLGKAFGDWDDKKKALDYLASLGVNSIYVVTNNIDADNADTWPWLGSTPQQAKQNSDRFDTARLAQWEDFFSYAESKGIVLHIILNDDSAWHGYDHALYYREMIARFGHHPGLIWNLGEEANEIYSDDRQIQLARMLRDMDPYRHPVTVHHQGNWPFIGNPNFDLTSIQAGAGAEDFSGSGLEDLNRIVVAHREKSASVGRPLPVMIDEIAGIDRVDEAVRRKLRGRVLYPIYLGGGNFELHFRDSFVNGGLASLRKLEPLLEDMRRARQFVESMPFQRMSPCNQILLSGEGQCFGAHGLVYALYLSKGGSLRIDLSRMIGPVQVAWFDPRSGAIDQADPVQGGGEVTLTAPSSEDWALRLSGTGAGACNFNQLSRATIFQTVAGRAPLAQALSFQVFVPTATFCH